MALLLIALTFLLAVVFTGLVRRYALRHLMDQPNARSSHRVATPRGGGVGIVLAMLVGLSLAGWLGYLDPRAAAALLVSGLLIAVLGFIDDHRHVPARWRLLGHFVGAVCLLALLGGLPPVPLPGGVTWQPGMVGQVLALLYLAWLVNLYNFMDGIDGIAAGEAVTVCLAALLLAWLRQDLPLLLPCALLGAASLGFLLWNLPPARIFMGDVGSGFLGALIGGLSLLCARVDGVWLWCWLILLGVFIVDATWTLLHRLVRGERIYQAHRSHAYQQATRRCGGHLPVTLGVAAINLGWLLPWAHAVSQQWIGGFWGMLFSYLPLFFLAILFRSGGRETS